MIWQPDEIAELEKVASVNDGRCDRCRRAIKVYRYRANRTMALTMRRLAEEVKISGVNDINVEELNLPYGMRSQLSKVRLHGLIAKVKDKDGKPMQSHWLITAPKGWGWLNGKPIQEKVVTFGNQVLGHEGGMVTIYQALGEKPSEEVFEQDAITEPEAAALRTVRKPQKKLHYRARFKARNGQLSQDSEWDIELDHLQVGKPLKVRVRDQKGDPLVMRYDDIAAFQKKWTII